MANPGCYATGAIALIRPLVDAGLLPADFPLALPAVSGYSGGGRQMMEAYEAGTAPLFELYALGLSHKHLPEIMQYTGLSRRPIFIPSVGNFISVEVGADAGMIYQRLLKQGVIVRPVGNYRMPRHLRITVGLPAQNEFFLKALANALAGGV